MSLIIGGDVRIAPVGRVLSLPQPFMTWISRVPENVRQQLGDLSDVSLFEWRQGRVPRIKSPVRGDRTVAKRVMAFAVI